MSARKLRRKHNQRRKHNWAFYPWVRLQDFKVLLVEREPDMYDQLSKPVQINPSVKLIQGEVGVIDSGFRFVEVMP